MWQGLSEKGFTRRPEVRAILDRHEQRADPRGEGTDEEFVQFEGLTLDDAIRLMELLPESQMELRQNESPSIREMIRLGHTYPGITFHGYRIGPVREDERIQFEGFYLPKATVSHSEVERLAEELGPDLDADDLDQGEQWYFWWD